MIQARSRANAAGCFLAATALIASSFLVAQDSKAQQLAERVMDAMGGKQAWEETRFIRFSFANRRTHLWDKHSGRHRMEGQNRDGQSYVVLHNINQRGQGQAFIDGQPAQGEQLDRLLNRAYSTWINDTYWLLMPYKLLDPGVNLTYDGEEEIDGTVYDKLLLTFEGVGLTPGDRYWAFINRSTGLMDRWAYRLQRQEADANPTAWEWTDWKKYGRVMLASGRKRVGREGNLPLGDIAVMETVPDSAFTSPDPVQFD